MKFFLIYNCISEKKKLFAVNSNYYSDLLFLCVNSRTHQHTQNAITSEDYHTTFRSNELNI